MNNSDTQVLKGILSMLLLQVLDQEEDYGYAIVLRLRALGFEDLAEGTIYPALTRLEKKELLTSRLVPSDSGPARKYYRLTKTGRAELSRAAESWTGMRRNVDRVMAENAARTKSTVN